MAYAWQPTTQQVAAYVPWLTISVSAPGSQSYLGDFTSDTSPNAAEAGQHISDTCSVVGAVLLPLGAAQVALADLARVTAALLAAATLAAAYARTDDDVARAAALLARYQAALASLTTAADNAGAAALDPLPIVIAPPPVEWGDELLQDHYGPLTGARLYIN